MSSLSPIITLRTFLGFFPPPDIQEKLAAILSRIILHPPAKREDPEKIHLTIKFLGDALPMQVEQLKTIFFQNPFSIEPFEYIVNTCGFFPSSRNAKILWLGSIGPPPPSLLAAFHSVEKICETAGFRKEERAFHPHLTAARTKNYFTEDLTKMVEKLNFEPLSFRCSGISVMHSTLHPTGSKYRTQFIIPLNQQELL